MPATRGRHRKRPGAIGLATAFLLVTSVAPVFFRRRPKATRDQAFADLFDALATLYAAAAGMKAEWAAQWEQRADHELPPRFQLRHPLLAQAVHDVRFARALLQRNRWKSQVQPLFEQVDEASYERFTQAATLLPATLLDLSDQHAASLREDERDWIEKAVELLDDAGRRRRAPSGYTPFHRHVAEAVYQPVFIAIHLSDRLVERLYEDLLDERG